MVMPRRVGSEARQSLNLGYSLCDFEQVTQPHCTSVFSSAKRMYEWDLKVAEKN